MVSITSENLDVLNHKLYFDNFFTSYELMSELAEKYVHTTGTIRENRTGGTKQKLMGYKELQTDGKVFVAKWHNNFVVTMASN